jgi:hypothetical protein
MDMFFFFLPYIVLGITLVVAITVPATIWLLRVTGAVKPRVSSKVDTL